MVAKQDRGAVQAHEEALVEVQPLRGPEFSTYRADDVGWLLTDLESVSSASADSDERHRYYRDGVVAELAPASFQPSAEYEKLLVAAIERHALQIATAVGALTETTLARLGGSGVVASILRAGVPVGVLMHRWARRVRGVDLPHYAISIVQEAGLDAIGLQWLAHKHDPQKVVFVDGWTGKGTVALTFKHSVEAALPPSAQSFSTTLSVLADVGSCTDLYGTREDFLIPSACLDSAASGLVSRSIYHPEAIPPGHSHGAVCHRHLAARDTSIAFLDAVEARFEEAAHAFAHGRTAMTAPNWSGRRAAERLVTQYGVDHIDLVKPGVCETTRVLVQWHVNRILIRPSAAADLDHVLLLAEERDVPVDYADDLPFNSVALVPPRPILAYATPTRPYR